MKKITKQIVFIIFLFYSINSVAQKWDTKEQKYNGGVALSGIVDISLGKVLGLNPIGKEVSITYDPFYNKYIIDWIEEDGTARMNLKFKEENSGGKMYVDTYSSNTAYFIHDHLKDENKLTIMSAEPTMLKDRKVKLILVFDDLK